MAPEEEREESFYVATPKGIFTASGIWFQATEASLREYAGPVLQHVPLEELLRQATAWLRSSQVLTLWLLPVLLLLTAPLPAAGAALVLYVGWKSLSPSFASRYLAEAFRRLDNVLVQACYYVFMLSIIAAQGRIGAMTVGLAGFILVRWGLVARVTYPVVRAIARTLYELPLPDQVLRAFILRVAITHGVDHPQVDRIIRQIFEKWSRRDES